MTIQSMMQLPHEDQIKWFQDRFRPDFDRWVIETGQRILDKDEPLVAFLWISCAIDWLAGFRFGKSTIGRGPEAYKGYIDDFFPRGKYDAAGLYTSLRNGFVHSFTLKGPYVLKHNRPDLHLKVDDGRTILNAETLFDDLVLSKNAFFDAVESDPMKLNKVIERYEREGFFRLVPLSDNE